MRRKRAELALCLFILLGLTTAAQGDMVVQTCFSPQGNCSAYILREIEQARKELLVAVYAFTSDELASGLVQARKRGVSVQVILDREFDADNRNSKGKFLEEQKIPVRRVTGMKSAGPDKENGLMHQKIEVIDRKTIFNGYYYLTHTTNKIYDTDMVHV